MHTTDAPVPVRRRQIRARGRHNAPELPEWLAALGYALPALLLTLALLAWPLLYSFWLSVNDVDFRTQELSFVGLDNYRAVLSGNLFWPALTRTLRFAAIIVTATPLLAMSFALAVTDPFRSQGFFRSVIILPWSMSQVMLALTFGWIFNSTYGPLNGMLFQLGLIDDYRPWFAEGRTVLVIVAFAVTWNLVPLATLLLMAALQTVPVDLERAGRVDGAGFVRRFFFITVPHIRDTILVVTVLATLNAFLTFGPILVLTGGGPGTETTLLSWLGYRRAFRDLELGEAAAIFYLMTLLLGAVAAATVTVLGRRKAV